MPNCTFSRRASFKFLGEEGPIGAHSVKQVKKHEILLLIAVNKLVLRKQDEINSMS